ncbi:MAG: CAP domain-containing protein [Ornithinimicrobium sp.]
MLSLTNAERRKVGCQDLKFNSTLAQAAGKHSDDMADRVNATGYAWSGLAENIAAGQQTPQAAVDRWMNSPPHRRSILNCDYVELGVGVSFGSDGKATPKWTQNFGIPS